MAKLKSVERVVEEVVVVLRSPRIQGLPPGWRNELAYEPSAGGSYAEARIRTYNEKGQVDRCLTLDFDDLVEAINIIQRERSKS